MFQIRRFIPRDYALLASWWEGHGWPVLPSGCLPRIGMVVEKQDGNVPICMAFLYSTDSDIAWLEWVTADPKSDKMERRQALDILIKELTNTAITTAGFRVVFSSTRHPRLVEAYESAGWQVSDRDMTHMTCTKLKEKENI